MARIQKKGAWVVAVNMGYGHQRAAFPLTPYAHGGKVVTANDYEGIPHRDKVLWDRMERFYYTLSRWVDRGFLGKIVFWIFDTFQRVGAPGEGSPRPTLQAIFLHRQIEEGWGKHLIEKLSLRPLPLVCTFFTPAFMAERWNYPGPIYLVVTDSDISRAWAPYEPHKTRIIYLAPTHAAFERLKQYGIPEKNIVETGFPLPKDLVGVRSVTAKRTLLKRLHALDPLGLYRERFGPLIKKHVGLIDTKTSTTIPEIMFAIGGAGAQGAVARKAMQSLQYAITEKKIILHLMAGTSRVVEKSLHESARVAGLDRFIGSSLFIHASQSKHIYFEEFNALLARCHALWTKPSELTFYAALGVPLIIAPPVGSHEERNREWLLSLGAGLDALEPEHAGEWLMDFLTSGRLAECAVNGFLKMSREGLSHILRTTTLTRT